MSDRLDKGQFEQDWRQALHDAQVEPPKAVWQQLDQALTHAELAAIKRRLANYKWATIAAIAFGLIAALIALTSKYEFSLGEASGDILVVPRGYQSPEDQFLDGDFSGYAILRTELPPSQLGAGRSISGPLLPLTETSDVDGRTVSIAQYPSQVVILETDEDGVESRPAFRILDGQSPALLAQDQVDPSEWWVQRVPDYRYYRPTPALNMAPDKKRFWAALNLGTGYYNPNYEGNTELNFVNEIIKGEGEAGKQENLPELSESMKGGASYMLGFNMGVQVSKRWSLEGGMQYSLQGARTLSNLILESERFNRAMAVSSEVIGVNAVTSLTEDALTVLSADDTELSNTFQFVTLPLQAGYLLVDKRVSVRLNGGIAANVYLGNTIGGSDRISSVQINPQNSPYRALNIGTITGLEVGYRIFDHFHLSVEPVYQRSLHSLTKSSSDFVANPSTIGIETGLKYTF